MVGGTAEEWWRCATLGTAKSYHELQNAPNVQQALAMFHKEVWNMSGWNMSREGRNDFHSPICVAEDVGKLTYSETTKTVIVFACRGAAQGRVGV